MTFFRSDASDVTEVWANTSGATLRATDRDLRTAVISAGWVAPYANEIEEIYTMRKGEYVGWSGLGTDVKRLAEQVPAAAKAKLDLVFGITPVDATNVVDFLSAIDRARLPKSVKSLVDANASAQLLVDALHRECLI